MIIFTTHLNNMIIMIKVPYATSECCCQDGHYLSQQTGRSPSPVISCRAHFLHPQHPKCRKLCTQTSLGPSYWFNDHVRNRLIGGTDSIYFWPIYIYIMYIYILCIYIYIMCIYIYISGLNFREDHNIPTIHMALKIWYVDVPPLTIPWRIHGAARKMVCHGSHQD